jgi:ABC-type sugar transport system permease subunit
MAFTDKHGVFGLDNFIRFAKEFQLETSDIRLALRNTLLTFGILLVSYPFKVLVSYFIYKKIPFAGFYRIVFFLPTIIYPVAVALIFNRMVGVNGFIAESVQKMFELKEVPELLADSRFANWVVILQFMWLHIPGDLIIWGGTFSRIPKEVLESGSIDGTNWWTEFTKIIVPMVWPTVSLQMVLMFCGIFSASGNVYLLTEGNFGTMTVSAWMYRVLLENSGASYTSNIYNYLSAVGLTTTTVAILLSVGIRKFTGKVFSEVEF